MGSPYKRSTKLLGYSPLHIMWMFSLLWFCKLCISVMCDEINWLIDWLIILNILNYSLLPPLIAIQLGEYRHYRPCVGGRWKLIINEDYYYYYYYNYIETAYVEDGGGDAVALVITERRLLFFLYTYRLLTVIGNKMVICVNVDVTVSMSM